MKKTAAVLFIGLLLVGTACTRQRTQSNEWGCSFASGPIEQSSALKARLAPGDSHGYSNDNLKTGPADVRFLYIDSDPQTADVGTRPIIVPARGSSTAGVGVVEVSAEVQVRFAINEKYCDLYVNHLKRIDDRTELNFNAKQGEESGWGEFLALSMNQKLIEATRPVLAGVDYITLYVNGPIDGEQLAYEVLAGKLSTNLSAQLKADLGDTYFCGPSYKFDGTIDGKFDGGGCPPLEVTVKRIVPVDDTLIQKLRDIVANEEQQRKIESDTLLAKQQANADRDRAIQLSDAAKLQAENKAINDQAVAEAQATSDQAIAIARANASKEVQLAEQRTREASELEAARIDLAVANARAAVAVQVAANRIQAQQAEATFCVELAKVGIDCTLLKAAENSNYPQYNLGGGAATGTAPTVILDTRQ